MSNRRVRLCWSLGIILILAAQLMGKAQTRVRVEEHRENNLNIRCTIQVQDPEWTPAAPAIVRGKVENLIQGSLEINVQPILYLSSKTSGAERDKYWSPVDLFRDGPLPIDKRPMDQKGEVVAVKALPIKLIFSSKGESIDFRIDARHVLWARKISSVWPSRGLFAAVEPGSYDLRLVLETKSGDCETANVAVVVGTSTPHEPKP
jgi:hypothetical protein